MPFPPRAGELPPAAEVMRRGEAPAAPPGAGRVSVPDIVGLEADQASEVLQSLGFRGVVVGPDATSGTRRRVVAQSPAPEAVVGAGTDVRITVEDGGP